MRERDRFYGVNTRNQVWQFLNADCRIRTSPRPRMYLRTFAHSALDMSAGGLLA